MTGPFITDHRPPIGQAEQLAPDVRCITAGNGGPMTFTGTRSYVLGQGDVALIDPGPNDPAHITAIREALQPGERIVAVFVTHAHLDHSPGAVHFDAPVYGFGPYNAGRSADMPELGDLGGGEGIDTAFLPDIVLADGQTIAGESWSLTAIHTPGHLSNHLCFASGDRLFSGDHVMGWATTLISPPDGDLTAFMASLEICLSRKDRIYYPGHGAEITDPLPLVAYIRDHRKAREAQILAGLDKSMTIDALTRKIYTDIDPRLLPAASRNVLAHLVDLHRRNLITMDRTWSRDSHFRLI